MTSFSRQRYRTSAELRAKINWNPYKTRRHEAVFVLSEAFCEFGSPKKIILKKLATDSHRWDTDKTEKYQNQIALNRCLSVPHRWLNFISVQ
jgi:hypothetical protein